MHQDLLYCYSPFHSKIIHRKSNLMNIFFFQILKRWLLHVVYSKVAMEIFAAIRSFRAKFHQNEIFIEFEFWRKIWRNKMDPLNHIVCIICHMYVPTPIANITITDTVVILIARNININGCSTRQCIHICKLDEIKTACGIWYTNK